MDAAMMNPATVRNMSAEEVVRVADTSDPITALLVEKLEERETLLARVISASGAEGPEDLVRRIRYLSNLDD